MSIRKSKLSSRGAGAHSLKSPMRYASRAAGAHSRYVIPVASRVKPYVSKPEALDKKSVPESRHTHSGALSLRMTETTPD